MGNVEVESVKLKGTLISDLLKEEVIKSIGEEVDTVALILMKKNGKNSPPTSIVLNHRSEEEVKDKILHIDCSDSKFLDKIIKILEGK
ncbi:MAG: hypothetical protein WC979_10155 [Candidatus Pacearchaeota archaeon]|jgi:hypothetical protein